MKLAELAQIADILPPPLPAVPGNESGFYIGLAIILLAAIGWLLLSRSHALRLRHLRRLYQRQIIDSRQLAFELTQLLCQQHNLPRLSPVIIPMLCDSNQWYDFASKLHSARFSRHSLDSKTLNQLLEHTRYWLQQ